MTTESGLEQLLDLFRNAYKRYMKRETPRVARRLDRHESVEIEAEGQKVEFNYWAEVITYVTANFVRDNCPNARIVVNLDGNDSSMQLEVDDKDMQRLNCKIYQTIKRMGGEI